jgi:hypothetical protein
VELCGLWLLDELQQVANLLCQHGSDLRGRCEEELAPEVHLVEAGLGERLVQLVLECHGVVGEEQGVDIERERDRRITELADSVEGLKPSPASLNRGPPGDRPAAIAGAVYLRTVFGSTPNDEHSSPIRRPACQCTRISTTSITVIVLLAIGSPRRR